MNTNWDTQQHSICYAKIKSFVILQTESWSATHLPGMSFMAISFTEKDRQCRKKRQVVILFFVYNIGK